MNDRIDRIEEHTFRLISVLNAKPGFTTYKCLEILENKRDDLFTGRKTTPLGKSRPPTKNEKHKIKMKNAEIKNTLSQISSSLEALEKDFQIVKIEDVKKGDFFKRMSAGKPAKKVYLKTKFDRFEKKYIGEDWDDIFTSEVTSSDWLLLCHRFT